MRAMMSLPVPLSPWISTGTLALASLVRRSRTACMASVRPKTIASGGISPKGWTSLLTLLVVMAGFYQLGGERLQTACREPKAPRPTAVHSNLTYVVEEHQLTKEPDGRTPGNQGIAPTVTLYGGICANIFTQPKRFSGGGPSGCPRAPRDERTSGPADSTRPPALYEEPSRAESAKPSATGPSLRPGRLEFPTGFERLREKLGESILEGQLAALTAEREQFAAEKAELQERLLRARAEFENARRRWENQRLESFQVAAMDVVRDMLPIVDDFERALKVETADRDYAKGVELIYQRMADTLKKLGLEPIETAGQRFDPNLHQAVERVQTEDAEDQSILGEFQRGYNFKGKLLRPAMVRVAVRP